MTFSFTPLEPPHALFHKRCVHSVAALMMATSPLGACGQRSNASSQHSATETTTSTLKAQPTPAEAAGILEVDAELRRGYGVVDMRYDSCVTAQGDYALQGEGCASGFLIYGPYVNVPAKSEVEVIFNLQPSQSVEVYADIVSQMGRQALAGLSPQTLEAGVNRRLGYRVHISDADQFVESRIGLRSDTPVQFSISDYTMTVR
jgi:hypothetical protein